MSLNSSALAAKDCSSASSAGSSVSEASWSAARCTALGNTSLDDWPMFTWSLGCTPSPARFAMTSLAFMFEDVPEPVWKTSIGNWSSWSPLATSSAAAAIRSATAESSRPSSALARAAAPLIRPSHCTTDTGTRSPEMGKLATAFVVSPPHSCLLSVSTLIYRTLARFERVHGGSPRRVQVRSRREAAGQLEHDHPVRERPRRPRSVGVAGGGEQRGCGTRFEALRELVARERALGHQAIELRVGERELAI